MCRSCKTKSSLPQLPAPFEGFRLMQLADLHCDLDPKLIDIIIERIDGLEYDAAVLTGDYHNKIAHDHDASLELMGRLEPHIKRPRYAILGNHDFIEKVAFLESIDLTVLLNECDVIEREGARLWICGVDDPHFFYAHDLKKARERVPHEDTAILLSHSPETYQEAEKLGYAFMLSGHTHGGQLCLPGGFADYWKCAGSAALSCGPVAARLARGLHFARNRCQRRPGALQLSFRGDDPYAAAIASALIASK